MQRLFSGSQRIITASLLQLLILTNCFEWFFMRRSDLEGAANELFVLIV